MEITKIKTTVYKIKDVSDATMLYNETFKKIRENAKEKFNKCFICESDFEMDDVLHILFMENSTNKVACKKCAEEVRIKLKREDVVDGGEG